MRHFVIVGILVVLTTILVYLGLNSANLMPTAASAQGMAAMSLRRELAAATAGIERVVTKE